MFNPYTNSVLWPITSRNYQDYCSLLPERSETYQFAKASTSSRCFCARSRSRCFCCCCSTPSSSSFVKSKASINPGFLLYGLRQSTLIQWPSFRRRLLVGVGGDRLMGCEADGHCCESEVYSSCGGTRKNRRFRVRASEECGTSCSDDVEAMVSFLSEEFIHEERNWNSVSRTEERKKVRYGGESHGGNVRKVKVEERDIYGKREGTKRPEGYWRNGITQGVKLLDKYDCEHCGVRKKNSRPESGSHRGSKLVTGDSIGKTYRRNEEREVRPIRTKSSSCSSYYSLASSGQFESDTDDQDEDVEFLRENVTSSEKKVVEKTTKGMKSRKEAFQKHSRRKRDESVNGVGSSYHKQFSQTGGRVSESTGNHEEDIEIHEIHVNDVDTNSQNQKIFGEREDSRVPSIRIDSGRENIESSQQQLKERLGARYS